MYSNVIGLSNKIYGISKYIFVTILVLNLMSVTYASDPSTQICSALKELCAASQVFLAGAIMIMILMAGATYALGQVLGAETRARASVWGTAMMTGALIGALIYLITPAIINMLLPAGTIPTAGSDPCSFVCK